MDYQVKLMLEVVTPGATIVICGMFLVYRRARYNQDIEDQKKSGTIWRLYRPLFPWNLKFIDGTSERGVIFAMRSRAANGRWQYRRLTVEEELEAHGLPDW